MPTSPSDLILVRHGQSEWNAAGRWQGQADPPLSALGSGQAVDIAERIVALLDGVTPLVVTSDLVRAHETATTIADRLDAWLEVDPLLREIDIGSFSGRTRAQILEEDPGAFEAYQRGEQGWTGGETFEAHEQRSALALARLEHAARDERAVVAVSHGVTIRAITRELLGVPHVERWRMTGPGNCGFVHFRRAPLGWRMVSFNAIVEPRED